MQQRVRRSHRGNFLRPPGNSPSRWHLTRGLLLCSGVTIQHLPKNVKSGFLFWRESIDRNYHFAPARSLASTKGRGKLQTLFAQKLGAPAGTPSFHLAAAIVVTAAVVPVAAVAAAAVVPGGAAVAAAVAEQQDQDDDPPPAVVVAHTPVIVAAHNIYLQF